MNKFKTLWIAIILLAIGTAATAQSVGDKFKVGNLYYTIMNLSPREVMVVSQNPTKPYWNRGEAPMGAVAIPASVTYGSISYSVAGIYKYAFAGCSKITSISIPNSVKGIDALAFGGCTGLTTIYVDEASTYFTSVNGVLFNKNKDDLVYYPSGKSGFTYTVPSTVNTIGASAFLGCNLISIELPAGLNVIGSNAFARCSCLTSIEIPSNVTTIGNSAFYNCTKLKTISVNMPNPSSVSLGTNVFNGVPKGSDANACELYVPQGKKDAYSSASQWKDFLPNIYETINMSRWVELTVRQGDSITLNLTADAKNTTVKIVSGTYSKTITVGTSPTGYHKYYAQAGTMQIYGNVKMFGCSGAKITGVDASHNTALRQLDCYLNQLTSLNVQGLTQLRVLTCYRNQLKSLDVKGLTKLQVLYCDNNQLTSLDLQGLTQLQVLYCSDNQLTSLNLQGLTQLNSLDCHNNQLTNLDIQSLTRLGHLWCYNNPCTNTTSELDQLYCQLPERLPADNARIYVSDKDQANIEDFVRATNRANANSKNWKLYGYDKATYTTYEITNTTGKYVCETPVTPASVTTNDATNITQTSATLNGTAVKGTYPITERGFEWKLTDGGTYGDNDDLKSDDTTDTFTANLTGLTAGTSYTFRAYVKVDGSKVCGEEEKTFTTATAPPTGTPVISLTTTKAGATVRIKMKAAADNTSVWIETAPDTYTKVTVGTSWTNFTNYKPTGTTLKVYGDITHFDCRGVNAVNKNPVSVLDASRNASLEELYCHNNQLTSLNVQGLTNLQTLYCRGNQLQNLNVQGLTKLNELSCGSNQLKSLDVQDLTKLQTLYCSGNQLTSLEVQGLTQLRKLYCNYNQLQSLDVQGLTQLDTLECFSNQLTRLNLQDLKQLNYLSCKYNQLQSLDVQDLEQLRELYCFNNPCTSRASGLDSLYCQLPERQQDDDAKIYISGQGESDLEYFIFKTNEKNANSRNWKLFAYGEMYGYSYEITNTTGKYVCGTPVVSTSVTTNDATNVTQTSATLEGTVVVCTYDVIDERGFEWKKTNGGNYTDLVSSSTNSTFTADLKNLTAGTSYTFRAYVKVGENNVYGEEKTFTTAITPVPATVTTSDATAVTQNSATLNGSVNPGTDEIAEKGFEWKLTNGGTYADVNSTSTGNTFTADLKDLTANTSYTFKAYVKVDGNKVYGGEKTFTTEPATAIKTVNQSLSIYPNPANNAITVETDVIGTAITITDLSGRTLIATTAIDSKTKLDISHLSAGTYIVRAGYKTAKVVVNK